MVALGLFEQNLHSTLYCMSTQNLWEANASFAKHQFSCIVAPLYCIFLLSIILSDTTLQFDILFYSPPPRTAAL